MGIEMQDSNRPAINFIKCAEGGECYAVVATQCEQLRLWIARVR